MKGELIRVEIYKAESGCDGVVFDFHRHIKHPLTGEMELYRRLVRFDGITVFGAVNVFKKGWGAAIEAMEEDDREDEGLPRIEKEEQ